MWTVSAFGDQYFIKTYVNYNFDKVCIPKKINKLLYLWKQYLVDKNDIFQTILLYRQTHSHFRYIDSWILGLFVEILIFTEGVVYFFFLPKWSVAQHSLWCNWARTLGNAMASRLCLSCDNATTFSICAMWNTSKKCHAIFG